MRKDNISLRPLSHNDELTLAEAQERLDEVQQVFDGMKTKYTTGIRKYQFWMSKKDKKQLSDVIGILLPLSMQKVVQEQVAHSANLEETIFHKNSQLTIKIMDMMCDYVNTGTKRVGYTQPLWLDKID